MVSEELKNILKKGTVYAPDAKVFLTTSAGVIEFSGDDLLASIEVEQTALSSAGAPIGGLATGELKVKLTSFEEDIHELITIDETRNIFFELTFGDEIYSSDIYFVDKLEVSENRLEIVITAYDPVHSLNIDYIEATTTFPTTVGNWLLDFGKAYGVNIDAEGLIFINDVIQRPNVENMSAKQVLSKFLEWNFAAGIYEDGKIKCRSLVNDEEPSEELDRESVSEFEVQTNGLGKYGVNTLTLALSEDIESENHSVSDAAMIEQEGRLIEIRLSDNPFFSTPEDHIKYAPLLFELIKGFNYDAYELTTRALYIKPLEIISQDRVNSLKPYRYNIPVYSYHMIYDGAFKVKLAAPKMDNAETSYKWSQISPSKKTQIKVDKIDGRIEAIVEETAIMDEEIKRQGAVLAIEKDNISSLVSDTVSVLREYEQGLTVMKDQYTQLKQESDNFQLTVSHANGLNLLRNSVMYNDREFWDFEEGLFGETNAWSLTKTSKQCITGEGFNEQTIKISSGSNYAISFDYLKQSPGGTLSVYYILNDEVVNILTQTNVSDGSSSVYLENVVGGELTIGVKFQDISETQPSYVANLMVAKNEVYEWSPAIGEVYTINVLIDESGVKVKNIDGNAYTAMTPYEFAHYYDNEKVFSFDRQIANVQDLMVKGKTFEMEGGIKWINSKETNKIILVNLRGGS